MVTNIIEPFIDTKKYMAKAFPFAIRQALSKHNLDLFGGGDAQVLELVANEMVLELKKYFYQREIFSETVKIHDFPKTWWDAFKLRWFPKWALKRWQPEYQTINISTSHNHICPHLNVDPTKTHLEWLTTEVEKCRV